MPKPQDHDDNASEASYYSYSEYTIPASEVSVNRRWYNRLDNWRQDVSPSTPKNERHSSSSPQSNLNLPRASQDEVESTVSPKESISSRPSPRIMPRVLEAPVPMPLLREEPRIMNDGRMDMVRVYDAGNGIEARLHPPVMESRRTREFGDHHLGLEPDRFDQDVTRIKLPPSQGAVYTDQQARKLHPIQDPYRLPLPNSRGSTVYTRGPQLDRDLPPLPPSQLSQPLPRPPRKPPISTPISESFYSESQPVDNLKGYGNEGRMADSALVRLDTILERTDKENIRGQGYRKGTPYPSVRHLDPSETSTEFTGAGYAGQRESREDSESTVERVIYRTTQTKTTRDVPGNIPTVDDIQEHAPRKRYPDPIPARHISKRVSTIVEEPRRPKTPHVVQETEPTSIRSRPPSRVEQIEDKHRAVKQKIPKVDRSVASGEVDALLDADPKPASKEASHLQLPRPASIPVDEDFTNKIGEREQGQAASQVSVKRSPAPTSASKTRASTSTPTEPGRSNLPRPEKRLGGLKITRNLSKDTESMISRKETLENRLRESSHGSVWTDTLLSTPDSRHQREHSPENLKDDSDDRGRYSSSDGYSPRIYRRRSPSPPRRHIPMQSPTGHMGMSQMIPQQPFPGQGVPGQLIHPPMMPGPGYRVMLQPPPPPRPPVMPIMTRSLPPPMMSPPQATFPWMNSMSPPMTNWIAQRPTSGIPAGMMGSNNVNPSMAMRNSMSTPVSGYNTVGDGGTRRRSRPIELTQTPRDRPTRPGQRVPSDRRGTMPRLDGVPQSRRVRRSNQAVIIPRRTETRRPTIPLMNNGIRSPNVAVASRRRSSGGNGGRREQVPSRSRNAQDPANPPATGGNPATGNWVRNILTLNRRPGRGSS